MRRFTPEFALSLPVVADAQLSPDGSSVAFVVAEASKPSAPPRPAYPASEIHVVPADGSAPARQLTAGRADIAPRWSPDGRCLAFLSDREQDGQRQVHLLPIDGGEARQLTHLESDVPTGRSFNPLGWFPDGSRVVFVAVEPPAPEARARQDAGDDAIVFEEDPRFWRLWTADIATGETRPISPPGLQVWEFAISPDGTRVAAIASDVPYEWDWYRSRVVVFDVGAESLTEVRDVHRSWRQVSKPAWSPDGYEVAFLTSNWSDRGVDAGQPMIVSAFGGEARQVGGEEIASDLAIGFLPDGRVVTAANVEAGAGVSTIDVETGARTWRWRAEQTIAAISWAARSDGGVHVASVLERLDRPAEVHVGELDADTGLRWRAVTDLHAPFADVDAPPARSIEWTAPDGTPMQGFLVLPPGERAKRDAPLPLVTVVHGGPTGAVRYDYLVGRWGRVLADAGLAVFLPNFRGSAGWGLDFAEANIGDMGGADFTDITSGIDRLIADGIADGERLGICGWSYGGYMTAWAIGQTDRFAAAVAGAAVTDWPSFHGRSYLHTWDTGHYGGADPYDPDGPHRRFNPMAFAKRMRTPTLILHGEQDWDVPVEQGYILHRALKDQGVETQLVVYPREPHGPIEYAHRLDVLARTRAWFVDRLIR
jgi:dipeptidyl aminopeptidase/acylaminoacyl peptidase